MNSRSHQITAIEKIHFWDLHSKIEHASVYIQSAMDGYVIQLTLMKMADKQMALIKIISS